MYSTLPVGALVGSFIVANVSRLPAHMLWRQVKGVSGLSKDEFLQYFSGAQSCIALHIAEPCRHHRQVRLSELREIWDGFHPPQTFRYVRGEDLVALARVTDNGDALFARKAA
jgi:predicted transcriptional regulator